MHRGCTLPVRGSEAVGTGVAAADDDNALAFCVNRTAIKIAFLHSVGKWEEFHRLMDADVLATGDREVTRCGCSSSQNYCIELLSKLFAGDIDANIHIAAEFNAFGFKLSQTTIKVLLLHFEFWNAITQKAARTVGTLKNNYIVPCTRQLLCGSEPCRPRTDDSDATASPKLRTLWLDPSLGPGAIDNFDLNLLNGHRILIDANDACRFTRCRAEPTCEFRKVIGCVQAIDSVSPAISKHQIVPVGNQISEWTSVVAKRDTAVHASAGLFANLGDRKVFVDLFPISQANGNLSPRRKLAVVLHESG
jgi:hypothetical protein